MDRIIQSPSFLTNAEFCLSMDREMDEWDSQFSYLICNRFVGMYSEALESTVQVQKPQYAPLQCEYSHDKNFVATPFLFSNIHFQNGIVN